ncbi:MAG: hypothetical protein AAF623_15355 [Planctomycetota bacterium]
MSEKPIEPIQLYAWLKEQISQLEKELEAVKDEVFQIVDKDGGELEKEGFVFKCNKRPKYKFSSTYEQKNDELKALKKEEIENGTATIDGYSEFVTFRVKKKK